MEPDEDLARLLDRIRACRVCAGTLPLGPRPVLRAGATARLLIVGQAPGTKVHASGIPWNDASGDRLRQWLAIDRKTFYDESRIAIVPVGFCYPGVERRGGDKPPRPECAPLWFRPVRERLPAVELTLAVGRYAQALLLGDRQRPTMGGTVAAWRDYGPDLIPLPHPSWRNTAWLRDNPWFEADLLPILRHRAKRLIDAPIPGDRRPDC